MSFKDAMNTMLPLTANGTVSHITGPGKIQAAIGANAGPMNWDE
jgi:hypothetical protein